MEVHGLTFSEVTYPADYWMSAHVHSQSQLVLVLSGAIEHHAGRERHCMTVKSGGYVPLDEKHSDLFLGDVRTFQIGIGKSWKGLSPDSCASQTFHQKHLSARLMTSAFREFKSPDIYTPSMLEALTVELFVSLHRQPDHMDQAEHPLWLERARDLLHEEYSETLRLHDIALEVGVHPAHLSRAFRRRFGHSVGEYVRRLRIAKARHLLEDSEMSMGEVAIATGFADQGHFTRTFKKYTGLTPKACRAPARAR